VASDLEDLGWTPILPSGELPPDGPPRRVSLPGARMDLVAFRDSSGRIGVFLEACPHVGTARASLVNGQNEDGGLRCKHHGWKYDVNGLCVDIPDLPKDTDFSRYPRAAPLETSERDGTIWVRLPAARS
jgi:phenylpropionate dioxygenase-like ring-hydroxylating dioxygenase large terminal subunit